MLKNPFIFFLLLSSLAAQSQTVQCNPRAAVDYSANIAVNELAMAVDSRENLGSVKIFAKKDGLYQKIMTNISIAYQL